MPSIVCERRSRPPSPVQSPPRKKCKFSLKLKPKKRAFAKTTNNEYVENETKEQAEEHEQRNENKSPRESSKSNISVSDTSSSVVPETATKAAIPPLPYTGLANLGNTCYLNAVLQVLRYCPEFLPSLANLDKLYTHYKSTKDETSSNGENCTSVNEGVKSLFRPSIIHSVHKLTCEMENAEENYKKMGMDAEQVKNRSGCTTLAVQPQDFVKEFSGLRPMFGGYQQHDAQEFLRSFLSLVEEDCIGLVKGDSQKEYMKGNMITSNTSNSKIRGGSKYPHNLDGLLKTVAEPTSTTSTTNSDSTRSEVCTKDWNNPKPSCESKTSMTKCFHQDLNCTSCAWSEGTNIVKRLFEGELQLQTRCLNCEGVRQRYENFQDISVPVQNSKNHANNYEEVDALSDSEDECDKDVNLSWAISKFASVEHLKGENKYFCDSCATLTEAEISTYFEKLPRVLTIHLKQFQTSYGQSFYSSGWITKVTKSLHTPQQLSLKKWCSKTCPERTAVYRLFGVVMHSGMSSCSGHYLSYVNVDILNEQRNTNIACHDRRCTCIKSRVEDRDPDCEELDEGKDSMETGCSTVQEKMQDDLSCSVLQNGSSIKSGNVSITKYFEVLRKSKDSENLAAKLGTITCSSSETSTHSREVTKKNSEDDTKPPGQESKTCLQGELNKTDASTNRTYNENETQTNREHHNAWCLDSSNTSGPISTSQGTKWLKFDDAEVQEISEKDMDEVLSPSTSCYSTPYVLFYYHS